MNSKIKYLLWLLILFSTTMICGAFITSGTAEFGLAEQEILLRKIGHEILLQSGDSTSRVLPIKKVSSNVYQVSFENQFSFKPDSLERTITKALANNTLGDRYIVNVIKCSSNEVIYGYMMSSQQKNDRIPCSGRTQPKDCYLINIKFDNNTFIQWQGGYMIGGLGLITSCTLLFGFAFFKPGKKHPLANANHLVKIGNTIFDTQKSCLLHESETISLTAKEHKLLLIFAKSPNSIIERNRLQKEIWEDEGVIVGRSLDMFISKLRKKLQADSSISITNVHGKGYKLEILSYFN